MLIEARLQKKPSVSLKENLDFELHFERKFDSEAKGLVSLHQPKLKAIFKCSADPKKSCDPIQMLYVPQLGLETTNLHVEFLLKNDTNSADFPFEGVVFSSKTGNPEFVQLLTTTKYTLFFFALISGIIFYRKMKAVPLHMRVVEQKLLLRQSILLVLYNDPFYAMIFYSPNNFQ